MSFSLLHVPKKAALTVWSGLAVGTSCTLALVLEDRRRRINQARSAVRNAERIRAAKQYHASELRLDDVDASIKNFNEVFSTTQPVVKTSPPKVHESTDPGPMPHATSGQLDLGNVTVQKPNTKLTYAGRKLARRDTYHDWQRKPDYTGMEQDQLVTVKIDHVEAAAPMRHPLPTVRPLHIHPMLWTSGSRTRARKEPPPRDLHVLSSPPETQVIDLDENIQLIDRALHCGDQTSVEQAVGLLRSSLRKPELTAEEKISLVQAATKLCLKCQELGLMDQAMRALYSAIELGPMTEEAYHATNPRPVVQHALSIAQTKIANLKQLTEEKGWKASHHERLLLRKRLDRTVTLIIPPLHDRALSPEWLPEWVLVAEECMHLALDLEITGDQPVVILRRIHAYGGDPLGLILLRYLERLARLDRFSSIVDAFKLYRNQLVLLDSHVWGAVGNIVTDAVDKAHGVNAAKVLKVMVESCPEPASSYMPLRTTWVTKLLYCHWNRAKSFEETLALFNELRGLGAFEKVVHKDGTHRTMIQIAMEAEQWEQMDALLKELVVIKPNAMRDAQIVGLMALPKARLGDWNAVWSDFRQIEVKDRSDSRQIEAKEAKDRMANAFAPILREFIKTHTTRETEDFLKAYIQEMNMPISPYMVNMVANRYGAIRDIESFLDWLEWCSKQGFEVDDAFGNAIIHNCRRRWDCSFEQLRLIYRTLQALNPTFVDDTTEIMMVYTGLGKHRKAKIPLLKREIAFATRKFHKWTDAESAAGLRVDMRHALLTRNYRKVLFKYWTAVRRRKDLLDEGHLRLAIRASMAHDKDMKIGIKMVKEAKERGIDVKYAVTYFFITQLRLIFDGDTSDQDQLLREVQNCIAQFEDGGLSIGHRGLLRVAHQLLEAHHFAGAISFGMSALQSKGVDYPDDIPTFQLFFAAYATRADVRGMKWTLTGAVHEQYFYKRAVFTALKNAHNKLAKQIRSTDVKEALWVVEEGLDLVRQKREEVADDRIRIERRTLEIMASAAVEAAKQPKSEEAIARRDAAIVELEAKSKRYAEQRAARAEARRVEMQARKEAAEEQARLNQKEADALEQMLSMNKHDISGDF